MRDVIIVSDFYKDPDRIVRYALRQRYYYPFADEDGTKHDWRGSDGHSGGTTHWRTSYYRSAAEDPFKSSRRLIARLEEITGEEMDLEYWNRSFPTAADQSLPEGFETIPRSSRWNCSFHVKHLRHPSGTGVHRHAEGDEWNAPGAEGWVGVVYLSREADLDTGLMLWRNRYGNDDEWMSDADRWELVDRFGNVFNRLILCRGRLPHSGGNGWGDSVENGRLFQTLFFRTLRARPMSHLDLDV